MQFLHDLIHRSTQFSIDIGSDTTKVAFKSKVAWHEKTCVAVHSESHTVVCVGNAAFSLIGKTPQHIRVFRPVQFGMFTSEEMARLFLTTVWQQVRQQYSPSGVGSIAVHLPSVLTPSNQALFKQVVAPVLPQKTYQTTVQAIAALHRSFELEPTTAVLVTGATTSVLVFFDQGVMTHSFTRTIGVQRAAGKQGVSDSATDIWLWIRESVAQLPEEYVKKFADVGLLLAGGGALTKGLASQLATSLHLPVTPLVHPVTAVCTALLSDAQTNQTSPVTNKIDLSSQQPQKP